MLSTLHGFGNRIRSVAGAWCLAAELRRRLHIVWRADEACGAALDDLFEPRLIGGGLLQGHYLQSVTESLALGAEGLYHVHRPITGLTGVARCVWGGKGDNVLTAKSSTLGSHELAYSRKVAPEPRRAQGGAKPLP